jgi:hypothetical protein
MYTLFEMLFLIKNIRSVLLSAKGFFTSCTLNKNHSLCRSSTDQFFFSKFSCIISNPCVERGRKYTARKGSRMISRVSFGRGSFGCRVNWSRGHLDAWSLGRRVI